MANLIGQTLLNQFRVDSFVASGGMGTVYRVWDLKRNAPLAMKVLHSELAENPSIFKRFKREADALKKLTHPNIVPFYGLYRTMDFAFLLELFIDGPSLKEIIRLRQREPFPIEEALVYMKALCAALGYAHTHGVVHCDVKPGNVMIDRGGNIFLTDFGIARRSDSTTTTMGQAGTPTYMPPEQILGKAVTPATDIYALGAMLFEMLTGQRLFLGQEAGTEKGGSTIREKVLYAHLHTPPPDPRTINPSIPEPLSKVILKSLSKDQSDRFKTTAEFFAAACNASGLSPETIRNRAVIFKDLEETIVEQTVVESVPDQIRTAPQQPVTMVVQKVRSLPSWQIFVVVALVLLALLLMIGVPSFSSIFTQPTVTSSPTATRTPTATSTPKPPPTLTPTPRIPVFDWTKSVVDEGNNKPGIFLSLDIDTHGEYYLAYFLERSDDLMIVEGDGKTWKPLGNIRQLNGEGEHVGLYINLNLSDDDIPYLSYMIYERNRGRGVYLISDGTWSTATISTNLKILDMRVEVDNEGIPHYVALSKTGDILYRGGELMDRMIKLDNKALPPDTIEVISQYFPIAMAVDASQDPYICFFKSDELQCTYKTGSSWKDMSVAENGIYPSLQIDNAGNLHLAYYDYEEKSLKYAYLGKGSSKWAIYTVDSEGDVGWYPSLKVDKNKFVHISYYDASNTSLKYAIGRMGEWSIQTIDKDGNVGITSSLVIDAQNNPAIAYYDSDNKRIYFSIGHRK